MVSKCDQRCLKGRHVPTAEVLRGKPTLCTWQPQLTVARGVAVAFTGRFAKTKTAEVTEHLLNVDQHSWLFDAEWSGFVAKGNAQSTGYLSFGLREKP